MLPKGRATLHRLGVRHFADVVNIGAGRPPIVSHGPAGRSAVTGQIATVFGCTGFLGRYLVAKLAKQGTQVVVPYRDEDSKRHLRVMGDLGQIVPLEFDVRNPAQLDECVRHSHIVYNLIGRDYETKNFSYEAVNVTAAEAIAAAATRASVPRLVHVSHLNAAPDSSSVFYATKAAGEAAVRAAFPEATLVRPAAMFGWEDRLLNSMFQWPIWWTLNHARTRVRPAHVLDVAQAMMNLAAGPPMPGVLSLPGPMTHTHGELLDLVAAALHEPRTTAPSLPKWAALAIARVAQAAYWPMISPDEVQRRFMDDVGARAPRLLQAWEDARDFPPAQEEPGDWARVGVVPDDVNAHALAYLRQYRSIVNFARPLEGPPRVPAAGAKA